MAGVHSRKSRRMEKSNHQLEKAVREVKEIRADVKSGMQEIKTNLEKMTALLQKITERGSKKNSVILLGIEDESLSKDEMALIKAAETSKRMTKEEFLDRFNKLQASGN